MLAAEKRQKTKYETEKRTFRTVSKALPSFPLARRHQFDEPRCYSSHIFPAFYYCYDHVKNLDLMMAEVNNTFPNRTMMGWMHLTNARPLSQRADATPKVMHVSPSMEMGLHKCWRPTIDDAAYDRCDSLGSVKTLGQAYAGISTS